MVLGGCVWFCGLFAFDTAEQGERTENSSGIYLLVLCLAVLCSPALYGWLCLGPGVP